MKKNLREDNLQVLGDGSESLWSVGRKPHRPKTGSGDRLLDIPCKVFIYPCKRNCLLLLDFVCLSIQHSHQGCYGTFLYSFNKQNFRFVETEALGSIMEYTGDLFTSGNNDHCIELWCSHMCTSVTYLALSFSSSKSSWLDS